VLRAGLRLLEDEETRIFALRNAIQVGLDSGVAVDFDPEKPIKLLKRQKK
jgi:antitoxin ParD1/3/4